jgi:hypothetical protein
MRSIGDDLRDEDDARVARMTPAERVRLAHSLGEANLTLFQRAHHLDRAAARRRLERERQNGRAASSCMLDLLT